MSKSTTDVENQFITFDKIDKRKHFCQMRHHPKIYWWEIVGINGRPILMSKVYHNKAQSRNVGKKFAQEYGIEWRE